MMKKHLFKPGFEFLFSAGIVAALALPQLLFAQKGSEPRKERKEIRITIKDNDTTFNGKNLKDLPPKERQQALVEIDKMDHGMPFGDGRRNFSFRFKRDKDGKDSVFNFEIDSAHAIAGIGPRMRRFRIEPGEMGRAPQMRFRLEEDDMLGFDEPRFELRSGRPMGVRGMNFNHRNSQNFNFSHTNKDGITTHQSYTVSDAQGKALKDVAGITKTDLDLTDLTLTPQFSAGKTTLSFALPTKTTADVQLTDSEGKALWKDKTTAAGFTKSFGLGLNGVYYLVVKQGGKTAVKRIVKEE